MALLTQRPMAFHAGTSVVDSTQHPPFGTVGVDTNGYEYMYVDFQQAFIAGELVVIDEAYAATNLSATAVGPVGVVMAAISSSDLFGWVMIKGTATSVVGSSGITDNGLVMAGASTDAGWAAQFDPASDAGNVIYGMWARSAGTSATSFAVGDGTTMGSTFTAHLVYPYVVGSVHALSSGRST